MRIAIGVFGHEANSFSPHATGWDDFAGRQLQRGEEMLEGWASAKTELSGAMSVLDKEPDCEVVPLLAARAMSGGPLIQEVFSSLTDELVSRLETAIPVDGVLLVLHGAMMAEKTSDATGEVLRRVRALSGPDRPVIGTLDLHANVTDLMVEQATGLVGYQTAPHVDMYQAGIRAAQLLLESIRGKISPAPALVRLPMILPPENSTHNYGPLADVIRRAQEMEARGTILHGSVYPTQPWLDTEEMASSVLVITDNELETAREAANELARMFWERRHQFVAELISPEEAVRRALGRTEGTVVLCDSADSTTSGSTGDSTAILETLLRAGPFEPVALLNIVDPDVVAQAVEAGVGATIDVSVGGKLAPEYFRPVKLRGRVRIISDGDFRHKGPGMHGVVQHMGRAVVTVSGGIHLVVMEHAVSQWDPELYRSLGEEPDDARMVQVKSPMAFRAAYEDIADEVMIISAPGAASPDLVSLPWKQVTRPIFPLDPGVDRQPPE